ncbi:hypothetical protein [Treponema pedis]|uniref:hypothetical protein n=2 Tax=Treponema pedis TaxID=409322 RepID=UPI000464AC80|nr:hypothetical protein [Treponema pedis]
MKIIQEFESIKFEIKSSMIKNKILEPNENGRFSIEDAEVFAKAVNETMVFNYRDRSELLPYIVDLPELKVDDAYNYLNTVFPDLNTTLPKLIKDE